MLNKRIFFSALVALFAQTISFGQINEYPALLDRQELLENRGMLGGVYYAYPEPLTDKLTDAPEGYTPFYISHYGRHGSRYQPSNARYEDTRERLRNAKKNGRLTPLGESVLGRIEVLCDSCLEHGGMLTSVGERQQKDIGKRMRERFPEVFKAEGHISSRASVVPRCGQSMFAFLKGFSLQNSDIDIKVTTEIDSSYMSYIAYDSPEMKQLSSKSNEWWKEYQKYILKHVDCEPLMKRLFTEASGIDTLQTTIDLYWLVVGMQNLDMDFMLDDVFTADELMACWQCVNYRMYICNGEAKLSNSIPSKSASSLLRNIIESADSVIYMQKQDVATLRFGHDSNLLRLLALMKIHNSANSIDNPEDAWTVWQESQLSPMAANLQLVFYRNNEQNVLVKVLLNENETTLDVPSLKSINNVYYRWDDLKEFFMSVCTSISVATKFVEPIT